MKLRESIYVIGEGLTEKYYFQHLKILKGYSCVIRPRFFSSKNSIYYLEKRTKELLLADVTVICAFDSDVSQRNEEEKARLQNFVKEFNCNDKVIICDSLPSIEFWFLLHFKYTNKHFPNYNSIRNELRNFIPDYDKTEKFLIQDKWVKALVEKQENAIKNGKTLKPNSGSYSNIFKAIEILESII
ncbi:MAG: RloB family protein [Bacteroidales bacterium]|nr:RloB family protein [Bacteroidales bacterium]